MYEYLASVTLADLVEKHACRPATGIAPLKDARRRGARVASVSV
jgi:hypothetical protein